MTDISTKQKVENAVCATDELPLTKELHKLAELHKSEEYYGLLFDCTAAQIRDNWPELFEAWSVDYDLSSIDGKQFRELKTTAIGEVAKALKIGSNQAKIKVDEYLNQELEVLKGQLGEPQGRRL